MTPAVIIRAGRQEDIPEIFELVKELAEYENAAHELNNTPAQLEQDGFGTHPLFEFIVAKHNEHIIGMALFFPYYSTWKGKTLYMEDLIVKEAWRKKGIGKLLMDAVVLHASKQGYKNILWQVLDWNTPAIEFYKKTGAILDGEWMNCKMREQQIDDYISKMQ